MNSPSSHPTYITKILKKNNINNKKIFPKKKKIKKSLYTYPEKIIKIIVLCLIKMK